MSRRSKKGSSLFGTLSHPLARSADDIKQRRLARRYQRWSEVDPLDDYARRARYGLAAALGLFLLLAALVVVGLIFAR